VRRGGGSGSAALDISGSNYQLFLCIDFTHSLFICFSSEYRTEDCIRIVLDKLEARGYRVISMTGIGQTCIWLSYKD
jgi:hypothetical protein